MKKENKVYYSTSDFEEGVKILTEQIRPRHDRFTSVYGIPKGGCPLAVALSRSLRLPLWEGREDGLDSNTLVVDDLIDSGKTLKPFIETGYTTAVLHCKEWAEVKPTFCAHPNCRDWIVYWWEGTEERSIEDSVLRQLQFIGEDSTREGLIETALRVVKSWKELYSGYGKNPADILKVFKEEACDDMVLLKDIEFYSTCEHHLLPFFGKAHIAYIPNGKVVGISKLARLLEIFSRRMQIQERIGQQVTCALDELLCPLGSACILEAQHFCMTSRGIQKQNSIMVTSSLTGVFRSNASARAEFMGLIK